MFRWDTVSLLLHFFYRGKTRDGRQPYKDPHEIEQAQEDGSTKKITINEANQLKSLMDNLKAPPGGVWLGLAGKSQIKVTPLRG